MRRFYTAESVTEGHPDKLCDLIADSILDECLKQDPEAKVACEVLATKGYILIAGEITSRYEPYVFWTAKEVLEKTGYPSGEIKMEARIHHQSPDIAGAVECPWEKRNGLPKQTFGSEYGAGDQGVMIGYACDETPQKMPMPAVLANRVAAELTACRKSRYIQGILPDGKAQVTVEYEDGKPVRLDSVVVSCQHEEEKDLRKLEKEIREKVLLPALRMLPPDENTRILINPSGRFVQGGLDADTGLTGRKLMVDAYGSQVPHGVAQPVMVQVDTFGTGTACADDCLSEAVPLVFELTPKQIMETLRLKRPIFRQTAAYGHFGRKEFPWERTDRVKQLQEALL